MFSKIITMAVSDVEALQLIQGLRATDLSTIKYFCTPKIENVVYLIKNNCLWLYLSKRMIWSLEHTVNKYLPQI